MPRLLEQALLAKLELVRAAGLDAWLVTQFCFEAAPILRLLERLRALGLREPLRVGLAGPADRRTLWKYALHCGIGNSIRALGTRVDAVANLLARPGAPLNPPPPASSPPGLRRRDRQSRTQDAPVVAGGMRSRPLTLGSRKQPVVHFATATPV